jgi:hypothetical protein
LLYIFCVAYLSAFTDCFALVCGSLSRMSCSAGQKVVKYIDKENMIDNLEIRATYYSAEFIEALTQNEAKKNLWTDSRRLMTINIIFWELFALKR